MAASEGVDLEWAIVELARGGKKTRKYSARVLKQAEASLGHIQRKIGSDFTIWHSDETIPGIGRGISAKPEPKTDIVIFTKSKKYFISVKMEGGIQLASVEGKSTAKLFRAAAAGIKDASKRKKIEMLASDLEGMPTRLLSETNLKRIIQTKNKDLINEFVKNGKIRNDRSYESWSKNKKPEIMAAMVNFINNDNTFYNALIHEAMTGSSTLKEFKGAVANSVVSPSGFYIIDAAYINKIKNKIKIDVRAKSRGGITSIAFRIETRGSL